MNGTKYLERPLKIKYAPPLPGQNWPPPNKYSVREYPKGCQKIFVANVSFDVEDEDVREYFKDCGEISEIRWINNRSGEFKGCGFIEFATAKACELAGEASGTIFKGRRIRIDWAEDEY